MKGKLTKQHIFYIEKEAQDPIYRTEGVISFGIDSESPFTIVKITPKGLIFIRGTDDTGFTHIYQRHINSSQRVYWDNFYDNKGEVIKKKDVLGRNKMRLDNPSNFSSHSISIYDFLSIADQVFNPENLNNEKNKDKDFFDVYDGIAKGLDGNEIEYRLITYKSSRIVHTLIPLSKKFNKQEKRIINFARQGSKSSLKLISDDYQIEIPYLDEYQVVRYIVIIREDSQDENKERWYIQINSPYGTPIATEFQGSRVKDDDFRSEKFLRKLIYTDLSRFEKVIKEIENNLTPREE